MALHFDVEHLKRWFRRRWKLLPPALVDASRLRRMRRRHIIPINQPLVLISQTNRSGGTLLAQLFSGNPYCHVHPGELHIGHPQKTDWPVFDLRDGPKRWFRMLLEARTAQYAKHGFSKPGRYRDKYKQSEIVFPFLFLRRLQRDIFCEILGNQEVISPRQIFDAYHTSYFNAWLDYQGLYSKKKKFVVGFTPRLSMNSQSVERFFYDYPDGRMISIVREPKSWFTSLRAKKPTERTNPLSSIDRWRTSTQAALQNFDDYPGRVHLVRFESLLADTEITMRSVSDFLDIPFDTSMTRPSFQGMDIRANSSFEIQEFGVLDAPLKRSVQLSHQDTRTIEAETEELYERARKTISSQENRSR